MSSNLYWQCEAPKPTSMLPKQAFVDNVTLSAYCHMHRMDRPVCHSHTESFQRETFPVNLLAYAELHTGHGWCNTGWGGNTIISINIKTQKRDCKSVLRANVLGYRIVNLWNSLPEDIVSVPTVNSLKGRFDRHCSHLHFSYNCEDFNFWRSVYRPIGLSSTVSYDENQAGRWLHPLSGTS